MNCAFGPMTLRALCNSLQASQSLMARLITIQASTMLAERDTPPAQCTYTTFPGTAMAFSMNVAAS